jgi:hypothetical protein
LIARIASQTASRCARNPSSVNIAPLAVFTPTFRA